jgi:2,3-bisphosphoglycerate-independent phosphoglycerate mutase
MPHKPIVLLIRDGWGFRAEKEYNGPLIGDDLYTKELMKKYPTTILAAAGGAVGLPNGYQGNSEVGHITIGAGRIIFQPFVRINKEIESGDFFRNPVFLDAIENCKRNKSKLHIMGLLQTEAVHAHMDHCLALLDLCNKENFSDVVIHVFSDGRDSPVNNTLVNVKKLNDKIDSLKIGKIATISGRYYSMDRDQRWERTKKAYDCIASGISEESFDDAAKCLTDCYSKGETDEFIVPRKASWYTGIEKNDSIIFYNFRTDRPRQLTMAMIEDNFTGWKTEPLDVYFVAMTEFYTPMNKRGHIAYKSQSTKNFLGQVLSANNKKQLRITETEKYAHVTYFFNGNIEEPNQGEDRILIPSPKVASYDLKPEMSAYEITKRLVGEIENDKYDVIVVNYANGDMVGHSGVWDAILKAVKVVDENVKTIVEAVMKKEGIVLLFSDHGNCEDKTEPWRTSHTLNPVPFVLISNDPEFVNRKLRDNAGLQDVAPTVLQLLGVKKPGEMTGTSIIL